MRTRTLIGLLSLLLSHPLSAQSPNAFGIPTPDNPQPAAAIAAAPGSRAQGWLAQGRSEILARHGMVATSDPLASEAGLEILRRGGNAIDAIVAASAVLDVTSQNDTGIAGDLFALVWSARDQKLYALNSAGWAPQGWTREFFTEELGVDEMPYWGVNAATVPGAISGYDALLSRFGTLGFKETFERAARLAEEGWGLAERRHRDLSEARERLREDPDSAATFLVDGEAPPLYGIIRNPGLAQALRLIQRDGRDAFYKGAIADAIVAKVRAGGGVMTHADLAEFASEWVEPISTTYHGYDVFQLPPPGQGFAALEMLNIIEACAPAHGVDVAALGPLHPDYWHLLVEAKKLAYSDLYAYNADPKFVDVPTATLLAKEYAAGLCDRIDMRRASEPSVEGGLPGGTRFRPQQPDPADRGEHHRGVQHAQGAAFAGRPHQPGLRADRRGGRAAGAGGQPGVGRLGPGCHPAPERPDRRLSLRLRDRRAAGTDRRHGAGARPRHPGLQRRGAGPQAGGGGVRQDRHAHARGAGGP